MSPLSPITKLEAMRATGRSKFEMLILFMCLVNGLPLAWGVRPGPTTLEATLHPAIVQVWSVCLAVGAAIALVGLWWHNDPVGLIIEEVGLAIAGLPSLIYAVILLAQVGVDKAGIPSAFILGFGIGSLWRYADIFRFLHRLDEAMAAKNQKTGD